MTYLVKVNVIKIRYYIAWTENKNVQILISYSQSCSLSFLFTANRLQNLDLMIIYYTTITFILSIL
jgi:hypothetical protein